MKEGNNKGIVDIKKIGKEYFSVRDATEIRNIWEEKRKRGENHPQKKIKQRQQNYQRK